VQKFQMAPAGTGSPPIHVPVSTGEVARALPSPEHGPHPWARGAARLESIFLDEGFGTLDPETLDVVAGTIESLGSGERVVGIVTHVPELAERMPVRFRVRKTGRTSTVTREEA